MSDLTDFRRFRTEDATSRDSSRLTSSTIGSTNGGQSARGAGACGSTDERLPASSYAPAAFGFRVKNLDQTSVTKLSWEVYGGIVREATNALEHVPETILEKEAEVGSEIQLLLKDEYRTHLVWGLTPLELENADDSRSGQPIQGDSQRDLGAQHQVQEARADAEPRHAG